MRRALGLACFACIGIPWIVWEMATKKLGRHRKVEAHSRYDGQRRTRWTPECPGCGQDLDYPHFHGDDAALAVFFPTSNANEVIEVVVDRTAKR